jgi:hypothetical protein
MQHRISQRSMRNGCLPSLASALAFAVSSAVWLCAACQSTPPVQSKEPLAASAHSGTTAAAQATQPLKGSEEETSAGAPMPEPAAVKLASPPPAEPPGTAPAPGAVAAAESAKKSAGKAGDKAAADPPAQAGKAAQGTVVSEEAFSTWLQATSPAKAGAPVQLEAVLVAKPPYHCNPEYPHKLKLSAAPAGLAYPEETVRGMKVTPERSVLAFPVQAERAGKPTVSGTLSFSVCTAERCMVEKRDISLALDVM